MENLLMLTNNKNISNDLNIDKKVDIVELQNMKVFSSIVTNLIDKGTNYIIKSFPISTSTRDVLLDVKEAFKTKDFKKIVVTAVNSSIREGLELLSIPKSVIKDITNIKNIAMTGGLPSALCAGIDIITNKYLKNNLLSSVIRDFIDKAKSFVSSKDFSDKITNTINKFFDKTKEFKDMCKKWYDSYEKFNVEDINKIARNLSQKVKNVINSKECLTENNLIQNMTKLINLRHEKLSSAQLEFCSLM